MRRACVNAIAVATDSAPLRHHEEPWPTVAVLDCELTPIIGSLAKEAPNIVVVGTLDPMLTRAGAPGALLRTFHHFSRPWHPCERRIKRRCGAVRRMANSESTYDW